MTNAKKPFTSVEICAGGGGQALGLERAGFEHLAVVEIDSNACETLRLNRGEEWNIVEQDVHTFDGAPYKGVDLSQAGYHVPLFRLLESSVVPKMNGIFSRVRWI